MVPFEIGSVFADVFDAFVLDSEGEYATLYFWLKVLLCIFVLLQMVAQY
jgi:hypothetical protein